MESGPSGARPRLVCSTTPVALMTRRKRRPFEGRQGAFDARGDGGAAGNSCQDLCARCVDGPPDFGHHKRMRKARDAGRKLFEHFMNGGQVLGVFVYRSRIRWYVLVCKGCNRLN